MTLTKQEQKYWRSVHSKRLQGLYHTKDTFDETEVCVRTMAPDDVVFTLIHRIGAFNIYNNKEFLPQVKEWKNLKCVLLDCNVFERVVGGKTVYMFIIQPEDLEDVPISPLALTLEVMVSGYAYITPHKSTIDLVKRILQ